jgi:HSP20 family protein
MPEAVETYGRASHGVFPAINAWEDEQAVSIEAELPGFALEDIEITMTGRTLTLAGRREGALPEGAAFVRRERQQGRFSRTLTLNTDIDNAKITASLDRGVLRITLPKAESVKVRRIEVKSA